MKTLFISDLDGTLLTSEQKLSPLTEAVLNEVLDAGICFSFATARSAITARKVTAGIRVNFPMVVYNGAFIMESESRRILLSNFFDESDARAILIQLLAADVFPIVYSCSDGCEAFRYHTQKSSSGVLDFVGSRGEDPRKTPVASVEALFTPDTFYFTCIDRAEKLEPLYRSLMEHYRCLFYKDIYSGEQWLEIMPKYVGKAQAAKQLARYLGCGRIVAFGDAENDMDLFQAADECYAVANAVPELKTIATGVIGSNNDDGVARWLMENYRRYE